MIDASVTLKWVLLDVSIASKQHRMLQPIHWKAEVLAVLARHQPQTAQKVLLLFDRIVENYVDGAAFYLRAVDLSHRLNHHLFDTLYHAVALESDATLITADERYFGVAHAEGAIQLLKDFKPV